MASKSKIGKSFIIVILSIVIALGVIIGVILYATAEDKTYTVTLYVTDSYKYIYRVKQGDSVKRPKDPKADVGYEFDNWFLDEEGSIVFDFKTSIRKDRTIYAKFSPIVFRAQFWNNFAETDDEDTEFTYIDKMYNSAFDAPTEIPLDTNFEFKCWATDAVPDDNTVFYYPGQQIKMTLDGMNLYAVWQGKLKDVTLTYDKAHIYGQPIEDDKHEVRYSEYFTIPSGANINHVNFTHYFEGYTIVDDPSGEVYISGDKVKITEDTVFFESWRAASGRVIFDLNGYASTPPDDARFVKNYRLTLPGVERQHYELLGWSNDINATTNLYNPGKEFIMPDNVITLYAIWKRATYTITYNGNGSTGGGMPVVSELYETIVEIKEILFERYNYEKVGWNTRDDGEGDWYDVGLTFPIDRNIVLYAIWIGEKKDVKYEKSHAIISAPDNFIDVQIRFNEPYFIPEYTVVPAHDSYVLDFAGFRIVGTTHIYQAGEDFPVMGTTVIEFVWVATSNKIIFDLNEGLEGTAPSCPNYVTGYSFDLSTRIPTRDNYIFMGWLYNEIIYNAGDPFIMQEGEITLKAIWQGEPRTLYFKANGGSGSMANETLEYNTEYTVIVPTTIINPNYIFKGWNTEPDLSGTPYLVGSKILVLEDMQLYAIWQGSARTVIFLRNGANSGEVDPIPTEYNALMRFPSSGFIRNNFTFVGWSMSAGANPNGTTATIYKAGSEYRVVDSDNGNTAQLTFYAIWLGEQRFITFNANGGLGSINTIITNYGQSVLAPSGTAFVRTNYKFSRWNTQANGQGTNYNVNTPVPITENITLYAMWTGEDSQLIYEPNNDDGLQPDIQIKEFGTYADAAYNSFPSANYDFVGWNTRSDGNGTWYYPEDPIYINSRAMRLYAIWDGKMIDVEVILSEATINGPQGINIVAPTEYGTFYILPNLTGAIIKIGGDGTEQFAGFYEQNDPSRVYSPGDSYFVETKPVFYIHWESSPHRLNYYLNYGQAPDVFKNPENYTSGYQFTLPDAPRRDNHDFIGWQFNGITYPAGYYPFSMPEGTENNMYALWQKAMKTINYHANGGTGNVTSSSERYESYIGLAAATGFSRNNYEFVGWCVNQAGEEYIYQAGEQFYLNFGPNSSITMYAIWEGITLYITLNGNNGYTPGENQQTVYTLTCKYGQSISFPNVFIREFYTFTHWNTLSTGGGTPYNASSENAYPIYAGMTLYAIWEGNPTPVIIIANNSSGDSWEDSNVYGQSYTLRFERSGSPLFTKDNYVFLNFVDSEGNNYADGATITTYSALTFWVVWQGERKIISFDGNEIGVIGTMPDEYPRFDTFYVIPSCNFSLGSNYRFLYWSEFANDSGDRYVPGQQVKISRNITLYAIWEGIPLTISYVGGEGTTGFMAIDTVYFGKFYEIKNNAFEKANYVFKYWNTSSDDTGIRYYENDPIYQMTNNITLYAFWIGEPRTITIHSNDGHLIGETGGVIYVISSEELVYGASFVLEEYFEREGYIFQYYATAKNGSGQRYDVGEVRSITSNLTLYAIWKGIRKVIHYVGNGGTLAGFTDVYEDTEIGALKVLGNLFTYENFVFTGWIHNETQITYTYNPNYETSITILAEFEEIIVLEAQWTGALRYVYYHGNGNDDSNYPLNIKETTAIHNNSIFVEENPFQKIGYVFTEWNTDPNGVGGSYAVGASINVSSNINLYARWQVAGMDITFDKNAGSATGTVGPKNIPFGSLLTFPAGYSRNYYTFIGWCERPDGKDTIYPENSSVIITGNIVYYAIWEAKKVTLIFDGITNGADTGAITPVLVSMESAYTLPTNPYTKNGIRATKWSFTPNGSSGIFSEGSTITIPGTFETSLKIYAIWD